jgi:transposase
LKTPVLKIAPLYLKETELIEKFKKQTIELIVIESTGGMERGVVQKLQKEGFKVAVINPKRARDFAKASGRLAKTDRIDAEALAHFGQALQPAPKPLASEREEALSDLVNRRGQLVEILNSENGYIVFVIALPKQIYKLILNG